MNSAVVISDPQFLVSRRSALDTIERQLNVCRIVLDNRGCFTQTFLQTLENPTVEVEFLQLALVLYDLLVIGYVVLLEPYAGVVPSPSFDGHGTDSIERNFRNLPRMDCAGYYLPLIPTELFFLTRLFFDRIHEYRGAPLFCVELTSIVKNGPPTAIQMWRNATRETQSTIR